jgi:hypothetical protein
MIHVSGAQGSAFSLNPALLEASRKTSPRQGEKRMPIEKLTAPQIVRLSRPGENDNFLSSSGGGIGARKFTLAYADRKFSAAFYRGFIYSGGFSKAQGGISNAVASRSIFDNDTFQRERSTAET